MKRRGKRKRKIKNPNEIVNPKKNGRRDGLEKSVLLEKIRKKRREQHNCPIYVIFFLKKKCDIRY